MKIGVVIPVFNREDLISNTLDSVFNQTFPPYHVVIVDDGSTDRSSQVIEQWINKHNCSSKFTLLKQPNLGVSFARNKGADFLHTATHISFLDSDDMWPDDFIKEATKAFENADPRIALWSREQVRYHETGEESPIKIQHVEGSDPAILSCFLNKNLPLLSGTVVPIDHHFSTGGFREGMLTGQDRDWALKISRSGCWVIDKGKPVKIRRNFDKIKKGTSDHLSTLSNKNHAWLCYKPFTYEIYLWEHKDNSYVPEKEARRRLKQVWLQTGKKFSDRDFKSQALWCYKRGSYFSFGLDFNTLIKRLQTIFVQAEKPSGWPIDNLPPAEQLIKYLHRS